MTKSHVRQNPRDDFNKVVGTEHQQPAPVKSTDNGMDFFAAVIITVLIALGVCAFVMAVL